MARRDAWRDTFYVDVYQLSRQGFSKLAISKAIGVDRRTFRSWLKKNPALKEAYVRGKSGTFSRGLKRSGGGGETFIEYVYRHLPPEPKRVWDKMTAWENTTSGPKKIARMLERKGKLMRQQLYIHALIASNFNASEALHKVQLSKDTLDNWLRTDKGFARLMDEIHWHKKNFVEGGLMDLVANRSEAAVIFASRTVNRDRGYDIKNGVEVTGHISHSHINLTELLDSLSVPAKREIIALIEKKQKEAIADKPVVRVTKVTTNLDEASNEFNIR